MTGSHFSLRQTEKPGVTTAFLIGEIFHLLAFAIPDVWDIFFDFYLCVIPVLLLPITASNVQR
jgi:hypothetical protein